MEDHLKIEILSELVTFIPGLNPGPTRMKGTNTYLVGGENAKILIDTGEDGVPQYSEILLDYLKLKNAFISHIIVTHHHVDHMGGLEDLLNKMMKRNIPTPQVLKNIVNSKKESKFGGGIKLIHISPGEIVRVPGASLEVVNTDGHCRDHISLHLLEENSLFTGDIIIGAPGSYCKNLGNYLNNLRVMQEQEYSRLYIGHGEPVVENANSKIGKYIEYKEGKLKKVGELIGGGKRAFGELYAGMYPSVEEGSHVQKLATNSLKGYIRVLEERELIEGDCQGEKVYSLTQKGLNILIE